MNKFQKRLTIETIDFLSYHSDITFKNAKKFLKFNRRFLWDGSPCCDCWCGCKSNKNKMFYCSNNR